jgi:hypothetical protein
VIVMLERQAFGTRRSWRAVGDTEDVLDPIRTLDRARPFVQGGGIQLRVARQCSTRQPYNHSIAS